VKKKLILFICLSFGVSSFSQNFENLEYLLLASQEDQSMLFKEYLNPLVASVNFGMGSGWAHTAKTHKKLGFDITISLNTFFIPSNAKRFSTSGLTSITSSSDYLPTVLGGNTNETLSVSISDDSTIFPPSEFSATFTAPSGVESDFFLNMLVTPNIQVGLGLPFKTDLIVRYIPTTSSKNTNIGLMGVGIKHNVLQYFGPADKIPLIDLSLLIAYSNYSIDYEFQKTSNLPGVGQTAIMDMNNYTAKVISSIDLKLITFYASIGYSKGVSSLSVLGSYDLSYNVADSSEVIVLSVVDPLVLEWEKESISGNIGLSFNLPGIKLFADYTSQEYNSLTVGASIGLR
jgi:hypothetical protein